VHYKLSFKTKGRLLPLPAKKSLQYLELIHGLRLLESHLFAQSRWVEVKINKVILLVAVVVA
jgi:hypothetical protein